ncbi:MAG TPA: DUF4258 domain-containing protein [Dehalococcoidia bacterium]|nr:DUF4258 domain-containing protein [Dehalococcoidia bacterium]
MEEIRARFERAIYREHAIDRMIERNIRPRMVQEAIYDDNAEVIEHYPDDVYGPCCTVFGRCKSGVPLHVRISLSDPPYIITVYDPSADTKSRWEPDLKTRRRRPPPEEER